MDAPRRRRFLVHALFLALLVSPALLATAPLAEAQLTCEVQNKRCDRHIEPMCTDGCTGRITLHYTVDCVGDGVARVDLGHPVTENGARVSFISVNGSAVVGADLPGGSEVRVQVTAERSTDIIDVDGPSVAPRCATTPTPAIVSPPTPLPPATLPPTTQPLTPPAAMISGVALGPCDPTGMFQLTVVGAVQPAGGNDTVRWLVDGGPDSFSTSVGEYSSRQPGDGQAHVIGLEVIAPADATGAELLVDFPACGGTPSGAAAVATGESAVDVAVSTEPTSGEGPAAPATAPMELPIIPLVAIGVGTFVAAAGVYLGLSRRAIRTF